MEAGWAPEILEPALESIKFPVDIPVSKECEVETGAIGSVTRARVRENARHHRQLDQTS